MCTRFARADHWGLHNKETKKIFWLQSTGPGVGSVGVRHKCLGDHHVGRYG